MGVVTCVADDGIGSAVLTIRVDGSYRAFGLGEVEIVHTHVEGESPCRGRMRRRSVGRGR
jgi:hypothetical protein